jgi:carbamoylphosphate synthase large subunit
MTTHLDELPRPAPRILLNTAGTGTTWGIATSARERWGEQIGLIATDMLPAHLVAVSALADRYESVPAVGDESFVGGLLSLMEEEGVNTYVPTFDPEIVLAARLRDEGLLDGVQVLAPPLWAAETCLDKCAASDWLRANGFPAPRRIPFEEDAWPDAGVIVKPRQGVGSVDVQKVTDLESWAAWCGRGDLSGWIAEELVRGAEVTLDCFRSRGGNEDRVLCRERVEVKSGVCTKARVFDDEDLAMLGIAIGAGLGLSGAYCLQAMRSAERGWLVTDINPRPGAGTRLSVALGVHLHVAMFLDLWGRSTEGLLPPMGSERWVVRQYSEIVLV